MEEAPESEIEMILIEYLKDDVDPYLSDPPKFTYEYLKENNLVN